MKKVFYLSTCDTCKRIIKELHLKEKDFEFQDIKHAPLLLSDLLFLHSLLGSYEPLFSKVARKYKELKLNEKKLSEQDIKKYLLSDYTFLKRPVIVYNNHIFSGNSKAVIEQAKNLIP